MTIESRYLFSAAMDVSADREGLFHEVYDTEHVPLILTVPGVVAATRFEARPFSMFLGGERKTMDPQGAPRFHALYELESPDVLLSEAFAKAVELADKVHEKLAAEIQDEAMLDGLTLRMTPIEGTAAN